MILRTLTGEWYLPSKSWYTIHAVEVRRNREIKWRKKINVYPIFEVYGWKEERNKKYRYNEWFNKNKREIEK